MLSKNSSSQCGLVLTFFLIFTLNSGCDRALDSMKSMVANDIEGSRTEDVQATVSVPGGTTQVNGVWLTGRMATQTNGVNRAQGVALLGQPTLNINDNSSVNLKYDNNTGGFTISNTIPAAGIINNPQGSGSTNTAANPLYAVAQWTVTNTSGQTWYSPHLVILRITGFDAANAYPASTVGFNANFNDDNTFNNTVARLAAPKLTLVETTSGSPEVFVALKLGDSIAPGGTAVIKIPYVVGVNVPVVNNQMQLPALDVQIIASSANICLGTGCGGVPVNTID